MFLYTTRHVLYSCVHCIYRYLLYQCISFSVFTFRFLDSILWCSHSFTLFSFLFLFSLEVFPSLSESSCSSCSSFVFYLFLFFLFLEVLGGSWRFPKGNWSIFKAFSLERTICFAALCPFSTSSGKNKQTNKQTGRQKDRGRDRVTSCAASASSFAFRVVV